MALPSYLQGFESLYAQDPRKTATEWFRQARFGLFMHYGLYSLLGRGEWVQFHERIPVAEYGKLADDFRAERFDADFITDLALEAGMRYVTITTRHHDSFSLWDTQQNTFSSVHTPAQRDLIAELAEACEKKKLGLFFYYSHGRDWRHPHAGNNDRWKQARPYYETPDPAYAYGEEHDLQRYLAFMHAQIKELLTGYGPVACIWLDGWFTPASGNLAEWKLDETYALIHSLQPQVLISYKWGTGAEDFRAPELCWLQEHPLERDERPVEICWHLGGWGYTQANDGQHRGPDDVIKMLEDADAVDANLLLNVGPLGDGSIDPQDVATLREVGRRLRARGWA